MVEVVKLCLSSLGQSQTGDATLEVKVVISDCWSLFDFKLNSPPEWPLGKHSMGQNTCDGLPNPVRILKQSNTSLCQGVHPSFESNQAALLTNLSSTLVVTSQVWVETAVKHSVYYI